VTRVASTLAVLAAAAVGAAQPAPGRFQKALVGKPAPELVGHADHWLAGPPSTLAGLKGKVVWVQFNF
jgi:hypothetical protein